MSNIFKKFFKDIIHDRDPEKDTVVVKGKPKPKYYGTVAPYPNFNASSDASLLRSAIESRNVDEDVIIAVLVKRSNEQRQKIKAIYEAMAGEPLEKALKSALRGDLEDVCLALLMTPAHFDAYLLRKATKRLGTDENLLVEVLATRTNEEIREIKTVFKQEYGRDLEEVIKDETDADHFRCALLTMLKANKDECEEVNFPLAQKDAKTLFDAGEQPGEVHVSTFIDVLTARSFPQLSKTLHVYDAHSDCTLARTMVEELKGDIEDCLVDIVKCAWNLPAFFAEKLHLAMERWGTCEDTLIRVLVSRSEKDLKKIVEEYRAMYGTSLQETIQHDTKDHLKQVLLGLCGPH